MPLIRMETSAEMTDEEKGQIVSELSRIAADAIGKPEAYVMALISPAVMTMAGTSGPAAFLDVRSIGGLNQGVNREISKRVATLLGDRLSIPADRVYISFNSVAGVDWGYNGSTFG